MGGLGPQKKGTVECLGCAECPVKRGVLQGGEEQGCRGTAGRSSTAAMPAGRVDSSPEDPSRCQAAALWYGCEGKRSLGRIGDSAQGSGVGAAPVLKCGDSWLGARHSP